MGVVENYVAEKPPPPLTSYALLPFCHKACTSTREPMRTQSLVAGYARFLARGGKPGPPTWAGGRPRSAKPEHILLVATPEQRRQAALAALERRQAMPEWSPFMREIFVEHAAREAKKPRLVVSHEPQREQPRESASTQLTLVHDADALAKDIAAIGRLATARIKETLSKPFDPADPSYQALLRFTSGVYNTTLGAMLKADENLLRARAVDKLPELLERVALEERKRHDRQLEIDAPPDGGAA
jgi:hypothetical protein